MFRQYDEGTIAPQQVLSNMWNVRCMTGALEVLDEGQHSTFFERYPVRPYIINFANGAYARITPDHPLWKKMKSLLQEYILEVFTLDPLKGKYVLWTGDADSLRNFDAIAIKKRS